MSHNTSQEGDVRRSRRLFVPALIGAAFSIEPPIILVGLLLMDIGQTFDLPVGAAGQIGTIASTCASG